MAQFEIEERERRRLEEEEYAREVEEAQQRWEMRRTTGIATTMNYSWIGTTGTGDN